MAEELVVVGAGGFGREVLDVVDAINANTDEPAWALLGVLDDSPSQRNLQKLSHRGVRFLGSVDAHLANGGLSTYVIGVGSPQTRRLIAEKFDQGGCAAATLIHPAATIGFDVGVGAGSVICAGARLTTSVRLGRHVHVNPNATVGHDTMLGDFVSLNPASSVSGDCVIEDDVLIGVAGVVLNQLCVGRGATVGGSACVVRDVAPGAVVTGVPARPRPPNPPPAESETTR